MKTITIPKEIYEQLKIKERKPIEKEVSLIFDKGQAIIRIPTVFNPLLDLQKGKKVIIKMEDASTIVCRVEK
jgi:antitoxin component of MazEF toxin-antitoxin module